MPLRLDAKTKRKLERAAACEEASVSGPRRLFLPLETFEKLGL